MSYWLQRLLTAVLGLLLSVLPVDVRWADPDLSDRPDAVPTEETRDGGASSTRPDRGGDGLCVGIALRPSGPDVRIRTVNDGTRVNKGRSVGRLALCLGEARSRARPSVERPGPASGDD
jgi:hypothetical protein